MDVSEERLAAVDEELAALGKEPEQIAEVLARFDGAEGQDLAAVDAELEALAADLSNAGALLEAARESVPSMLSEHPLEIESGEEEETEDEEGDLEMYSEPPPANWDEDADETNSETDSETVSETETETETETGPVLSEDDLFGDDAAAEPAAAGDLSDLFDSEELAAAGAEPIADIESAPGTSAIEHDLFDDDEPESTEIFTVDDVAAIERRSKLPGDDIFGDADVPMSSDGGDADDDLEAMLAADEAEAARQAAEAAEAEEAPAAAVDDELEMLLADEEIEVLDSDELFEDFGDGEIDDEEDEATMIAQSLSSRPPPTPDSAPIEPPTDASDAGEGADDSEEGEKKGGFFKKLFGND